MYRILWAAVVALLSMPALAADRNYIGISAMNWSFEPKDLPSGFAVEDAEATGLRLALTGPVSDNLSLETHVATGGEDTVRVDTPSGSGDAKVEMKSLVSMFLRPEVELGSVRVYGLAGYTLGRFEATNGGVTADGSDDDFSYGVGAEMEVTHGTWITADYIDYLRGDNYDFRAATIGLRFPF